MPYLFLIWFIKLIGIVYRPSYCGVFRDLEVEVHHPRTPLLFYKSAVEDEELQFSLEIQDDNDQTEPKILDTKVDEPIPMLFPFTEYPLVQRKVTFSDKVEVIATEEEQP